MSCNGIDYHYLVDYVLICIGEFRQWIGVDGLAYTLIAIAGLMLMVLFRWVATIVVPPAAKVLFVYVRRRAKETFNDSGLHFHGFRFMTCVASVILGIAFYALAKTALHFPQYWIHSVGVLSFAVLAFSTWGAWAAPNVKLWPFLKHFYIPLASAAGVLFLNATVEFAIALAVTLGNIFGTA